MKRDRAWRRAQEQRIKDRVKKYFTTSRHNAYLQRIQSDDSRVIGLIAHTRTPCSCWACGHRTELEGPPIRDLRKLQDLPS